MALSLGGGGIVNALMGQYAGAQRQRQRQQDQLMQMMQRGFVQTDQAQQARQGEGLLSQLLAPPERMRAQDFEMAPWNPARIAEEERKSREQIEKDRQAYENTKLKTQHTFSENQSKLQREHELELQEAKDAAAKQRADEKYYMDLLIQEIKSADDLAIAAARTNAGPDEWRKIADTVFMMDEKIAEIKANTGWLGENTPQQDRRIKEITRARDALWAKLPDEFRQPINELDAELDGLDKAAGGDSIIDTWKPGAGYTNPFDPSSLQGGLHSILTGIGQQFGKSTGQTKEINKSLYGPTGPY